MKVEIIQKPLALELYGYSGIAVDKDYAAKGFQLMDQMWKTVQARQLKTKGINIWVYEAGDRVFAGVEAEAPLQRESDLEHKTISLNKYAWYRHIGPYQLIRQAGQSMIIELKENGLEITSPYLEIYGHWTQDEDKLETELIMALL